MLKLIPVPSPRGTNRERMFFEPRAEGMAFDSVPVVPDPLAKLKAFLKGKISDEDLAQLDSLLSTEPAQDEETPDEQAAREAFVRAAAKRDRESMENAQKGAGVVGRADHVAERAEAIAQDQRRRAAEQGFASRYPNVGVRREQPRPLAMDRKASPSSAKSDGFRIRYPHAPRTL